MIVTDVEIYQRDIRVSVGDSKIPLSIHYDTAKGVSTSPNVCLIIYGGSQTFSKEKLNDMVNLLCHAGFAVATFDFRGSGLDSKNFFNSGLHTRIKDAREAFRQLIMTFPTGRFFVLAVSMGGYIATFLDPRDIYRLFLIAPAAYDACAVREKINFGPGFSEVIRRDKSYLKSDAFARMERFRLVSTTIVRFDADEVIPPEVILRYFESHPGGCDRKILKVLPGPHNGNFANPERIRALVDLIKRS